MLIPNLALLRSTIETYLARPDLHEVSDSLIGLAEDRIYYGSSNNSYPSPPLRLTCLEKINEIDENLTTLNSPYLDLPKDCLEIRTVGIYGPTISKIELVSLDQVLSQSGQTGMPRYGAIIGNRLRLAPTPDRAYPILFNYYRRLPTILDGGSNSLLEQCPGLYLYGALLEAQPFIMQDERLAVWASLYAGLATALMESDHRNRFGGRPFSSRIEGVAP
ncbi:MAG: hypothetical protein QM523_10910 [Candidatus Pacebacteria bacterium]|nr:hypothetical protein [Candidatus Paceibacterota bacterium]